MEDEHRKTLLKARVVLVEQLETESGLWNLLLTKEVFTQPMLSRITCKVPPQEKRQQLLDDLPRRGPDAFQKFLDILRDTQQHALADYLETVENSVRRNLPLPPQPQPPPPQPPQPSPPPPQPPQLVRPVYRRFPRTGKVVTGPKHFPEDSVISVQEVLDQNMSALPTNGTEGVIDKRSLMPRADAVAVRIGNNWEHTYRVLSNPKGLILIISNKTFVHHTERTGTEVDCENLSRVFSNLGYKLYRNKVHEDQKADEMRKLCKEFILDREHKPLDSCVLCVLSHGDGGGVIYGTDGEKVTEDELFIHFNDKMCFLHNKPKLVIIQACRGSMKDKGYYEKTDSSGEGAEMNIVQKIIHDLQTENYNDVKDLNGKPIYADIIFAHSTTPGFVSWRHEKRGSWFIQSIVKTFAEYAHEKHVLDMLTIVNRVVTKSFGVYSGEKMMPNPVNRMLKDFYFFPSQQ